MFTRPLGVRRALAFLAIPCIVLVLALGTGSAAAMLPGDGGYYAPDPTSSPTHSPAPSLTPRPSPTGAQKDLVVFMVDDLGAIDGRILERLPNINQLFLANGLRFDQAFAETPLCCPGRASFLTGEHTRRHGVVRNDARLLDPSKTIAVALHDVGYWTIDVGKYLNHNEWLSNHMPAGWDRVAMSNTYVGQRSTWWVQDKPLSAGYHDRFLADQALAWLKEAPSSQPVFLWLTPRAPHFAEGGKRQPWRPNIEARYVGDARCTGIDPWLPPDYAYSRQPDGYPLEAICDSLLTVDDMVGQIRDEMAAEGRDPVYLFTSDNGMAWGRDGYPLKNVPKSDRLPIYMAGAGVTPGVTAALISNIDLAPTLADLGGTTMPWADGRSFAHILADPAGNADEWLLEDHPAGGYDGISRDTGPWWGIRTVRWHLVVWRKLTYLYDLQIDSWEQSNVATLNSAVVAGLQALRPPDLTIHHFRNPDGIYAGTLGDGGD